MVVIIITVLKDYKSNQPKLLKIKLDTSFVLLFPLYWFSFSYFMVWMFKLMLINFLLCSCLCLDCAIYFTKLRSLTRVDRIKSMRIAIFHIAYQIPKMKIIKITNFKKIITFPLTESVIDLETAEVLVDTWIACSFLIHSSTS